MVITAYGDEEQDYLYVVEDVNPLLPLGPLTTNIKHAIRQVAEFEYSLGDTGRPQPRSEDVLIGRQVVFGEKALDIAKEANTDMSECLGAADQSKPTS
jgi:hypothetical protein